MPEALEIRVDATPNPNAIKLTLNRLVAAKGETYRDPATASVPWAKALLGIPGVLGVYGVNNFISINKNPEIDWQVLIPQAERALKEAFQ